MKFTLFIGTRRSKKSVHWVACGTCYTKTEGTELGGIELQGSSSFQSFEASNRGQFSCRCTLDEWLDLIGVISS